MPEKTQFPIDTTLTPKNAKERGYVLWNDVYINEVTPGLDDVSILIKECGYKLGIASIEKEVDLYGLYKPIEMKIRQ